MVIHVLILLWCVRQMRMIQSGIKVTVLIHALISLWCVRQMRMFQRGIMITVIHALILLRSARQMLMVNSHSCIEITVVCTSNAYAHLSPKCDLNVKSCRLLIYDNFLYGRRINNNLLQPERFTQSPNLPQRGSVTTKNTHQIRHFVGRQQMGGG